MNNLLGKTKDTFNKLRRNSYFMYFLILAIVIIVIYVLYKLYRYIVEQQKVEAIFIKNSQSADTSKDTETGKNKNDPRTL